MRKASSRLQSANIREKKRPGMKTGPTPNITGLLVAWGHGDQDALDALAPLVQQELHRVAARQMAGERPGHILQPTALVNEVYVRLVNRHDVEWQNRAHFFGSGRPDHAPHSRGRRPRSRPGEARR